MVLSNGDVRLAWLPWPAIRYRRRSENSDWRQRSSQEELCFPPLPRSRGSVPNQSVAPLGSCFSIPLGKQRRCGEPHAWPRGEGFRSANAHVAGMRTCASLSSAAGGAGIPRRKVTENHRHQHPVAKAFLPHRSSKLQLVIATGSSMGLP